MKKLKSMTVFLLIAVLYITLSGCSAPESGRDQETIIGEMVGAYCEGGEAASSVVDDLLEELSGQDAYTGETWREIMGFWRYANTDMELNYGGLPEDLGDGTDLCIAVLGFQLNPDGTIQEELENRLRTALACARQYPDAYVLCTGGGTAAHAKGVTEAGQMAAWLENHGLEPDRIIVEDRSLSTTQNAIYSYRILRNQYPEVNSVAIVTSDYHVAWGSVMFETQFILAARERGDKPLDVIANGAYYTGEGYVDTMYYQASGILSIAGISRR